VSEAVWTTGLVPARRAVSDELRAPGRACRTEQFGLAAAQVWLTFRAMTGLSALRGAIS